MIQGDLEQDLNIANELQNHIPYFEIPHVNLNGNSSLISLYLPIPSINISPNLSLDSAFPDILELIEEMQIDSELIELIKEDALDKYKSIQTDETRQYILDVLKIYLILFPRYAEELGISYYRGKTLYKWPNIDGTENILDLENAGIHTLYQVLKSTNFIYPISDSKDEQKYNIPQIESSAYPDPIKQNATQTAKMLSSNPEKLTQYLIEFLNEMGLNSVLIPVFRFSDVELYKISFNGDSISLAECAVDSKGIRKPLSGIDCDKFCNLYSLFTLLYAIEITKWTNYKSRWLD